MAYFEEKKKGKLILLQASSKTICNMQNYDMDLILVYPDR
jgi:hypothetical protein